MRTRMKSTIPDYKPVKIKDPVNIRLREMKDGSQSIFLDYEVNGKRKYEFLKLYLLPGSSKEIREQNNATMLMAQARKSQRVLDLQDDAEAQKLLPLGGETKRFSAYVEKIIDSGMLAEKTQSCYRNMLRFVTMFFGEKVTFRQIDKKFLITFVEKLKAYERPFTYAKNPDQVHLGNNSIIAVYSVLRAVIRRAYKEGILPTNPTEEFNISDYVKALDSERVYLEIEELQRFAAVDTPWKLEQRAFIFSCLCGLRVSDVRTLTWGDIRKVSGKYKISIRMMKTKQRLNLPLSPEALNWLPERGDAESSGIIFPLTSENYVNCRVREIMKAAGIEKYATYHSSRHTHATMMLTLGTDLYTVSKLMGHRRVSTTQIYANIVDKKKQEAIDLIPDLMDEI